MPQFHHLEFHRRAAALVPKPGKDHLAIFRPAEGGGRPLRSCTCAVSRRKTCSHLKKLASSFAAWQKDFPGDFETRFETSIWCRLARLLFEARQDSHADVEIGEVPDGEDGTTLRALSRKGDLIFDFVASDPSRKRWLERLGRWPENTGPAEAFVDRARLLERLALFQMKPEEREMNRLGMKSRRQSWEESLYHRLAYHLTRELDPERAVFEPRIDPASGELVLGVFDRQKPVVRLSIPHQRVRALLQLLETERPEIRAPKIRQDFDRLQLTSHGHRADPAAPGGAWYELSARYGLGNQTISLADVLRARRRGRPYLGAGDEWIDVGSTVFDVFESYATRAKQDGESSAGDVVLRLAPSELLRLRAAATTPVEVLGEDDRAAVLRRLVDLRPSRHSAVLDGLASRLRPYQTIGADWLRFLFEHRLGGLLCDDMGLGKTHQSMALMVALREEEKVEAPFLVVCPTSVLSHWRDKIRAHAPGLRVGLHHGGDRDLGRTLADSSVIITSYGILRNDLAVLTGAGFALAVFDEIQHLKNRTSRGYRAAKALLAEVKFGLTGTPIENTLDELKALFDLVLPGYLGADKEFMARFGSAAADSSESGFERLMELRRLTSPFLLRRKKATVLEELPDKIEDVRTCVLSEDQVKLYRDALATRGRKLLSQVASGEKKDIPYLHVFAVLSLLKQICNHPALALRRLERAGRYASGKWDLYQEILSECLDSGLKVVVFTQYLGMIELMRRHLEKLGVGHVWLTGASQKRGRIVKRFNEEPDCRVFLGSLKAGGTGIDLIGGSVVIHYDRWWTAAREDQATDRVHRMGQKRAVQVFKLVTEGTLEEKIADIIESKRDLLDQVAPEDDPKLAKIFSREEILELLRQEV